MATFSLTGLLGFISRATRFWTRGREHRRRLQECPLLLLR